MRGRIKKQSRANKGVVILIVSVVGAVLSLTAALICQWLAVTAFGFEGGVYRIETELDAQKYIEIEVLNIPLYVRTYDGDRIKVRYMNETDLVIDEMGYTSAIRQDADFAFSLFAKDMFDYKMEVLLPDIKYNSVKVITISGEVNVEGVTADSLYVSGRSGDVTLHDISGGLNVSSNSGDVSCDLNGLAAYTKLATASGDVDVVLPSDTAVQLDFLTTSGRFSSDFFRFKYNDYEGNLFLVMGDDPIKFQVFTDSGELTVKGK